MYLLLNPVCNNNTEDVEGKLDGDKLSTGFVLGRLSGPDRNNSVKHSCTPTIDETSADHPSVILSRSLQSSSDDSPAGAKTDGLDTTISITKPTTDETADESTEIVDGDNATLEKSIVDDWGTSFGIWVTKFHGLLVVINGSVDTTHHTLIISEEENGETGNTIDGNEKATLLKFVDHVGPRNDIHGGDFPEYLAM